jgi:F0F1-type ATP synthase membrane subunit b/b'
VELNATLLLQMALLIGLVLWLSPVLFGPALRLFEERDRRIHGAAEEAKRQLSAAGEKSAAVEQRLQAAQAEARGVLTSLREKALLKERALLDAARSASSERLDQARSELTKAADDARKSLKSDAAVIADDIVKKVLGRAS